MTRVDSDAWIPKAKKRKAYRDHYRDKFYEEFELKKLSSDMDIEGSPKKQRLQVLRLMNLTRKGALESEHAKMLTKMAVTLGSIGLGKGVMGAVSENRTNLHQYTMKKLRDFFHSPAFFD